VNTVARGEQVEADLDRLITKRHDLRMASEEQTHIEDGWAESVRTYNARRQRELCWEWLRYHVARQRAHRKTFALLDAMHEAAIQRYSQLLGIEDHEPKGASN